MRFHIAKPLKNYRLPGRDEYEGTENDQVFDKY
jgi:hypothetical protein